MAIVKGQPNGLDIAAVVRTCAHPTELKKGLRFLLTFLMASMNLAVPDSAILPRLFLSSSLVIPTPESSMIRVLASCKNIIITAVSSKQTNKAEICHATAVLDQKAV